MNENFQYVYYQLLGDNKLLPLSAFKSRKINKSDIFPDAKELPSFFTHNLLNQGRVVKILRGPEAVFRGFYYQLMKLGFEIENPKDDFAYVIKNVIFDDPEIDSSKNSSPISGKQYSNRQYLKIIAQFMELLQNQVIPNFEMNMKQYPIFDEAMLNCLQYLLEKNLKDKIGKIQSVFQILETLCQIFQINLQTYDSCVKFIESDVFLYLEDINEIYIAFLNQMAEIDECEKTSQQNISKDKQFKDFSYQTSGLQSLEETYKNDIRLSAGNNGRKRIKNIGRMSAGGLVKRQSPKSAVINVFQRQEFYEEKPPPPLVQTPQQPYKYEYQEPERDKQQPFKYEYRQPEVDKQPYKYEYKEAEGDKQPYKYEYKEIVVDKKPFKYEYKEAQGDKQPYKYEQKETEVFKYEQKAEDKKPLKYEYKEAEGDKQLFEQFNIAMVESKNSNFNGTKKYQNSGFMDNSSNMQSLSQIKENQSKIQNNIVPQVYSNFSKQKLLYDKSDTFEKNDMFFHPQRPQRKSIKEMFKKQEKKEAEQNEGTLGTFYRQFSDTKIMQAMAQPYKSGVNRTRSRFKGVRSKNFFGFY